MGRSIIMWAPPSNPKAEVLLPPARRASQSPPTHAGMVVPRANDAYGASSFNSPGNWSNDQSPVAVDDYSVLSLYALRSPPDGNNYTFAGGSLTLAGTGAFTGNLNLSTK